MKAFKSKYRVYVDGKEVSIAEAAMVAGMSYDSFYHRLVRSENRVARKTIMVEAFGETRSLIDWCRIYGTCYNTALYRLNHGWKPEDAIAAEPIHSGGRKK